MNEAKLTTLEQARAFLAETAAVEFSGRWPGRRPLLDIAGVPGRFGYRRLKKPDTS